MDALALRLDRSEYSRFEPSRAVVRVRVIPSPATALNETVSLELKRPGFPAIATRQIVLSGDLPKGVVTEFDLRTLLDEEGLPLAVRGDYVVEATAAGVSASVPFRVALVTAEEVRKSYCFGATLSASEVLAPKKQPVLVTGVRVVTVSERNRPGIYNLVYQGGGLSFGGGPVVTLDPSVATEILPDAKGGYVEVEIDHFELPEGDAAESLVIDKKVMDDATLQGEIDKATAEVESTLLKVFLEPTRIATEPFFSSPPEGKWFDRRVEAVAYYRRDFEASLLAWHVNLPVNRLISIEKLQGFMGNVRALEVSGGYAVNEESGTVDLVPQNSAYSLVWQWFIEQKFWGIRESIADFWRYYGKAGLKTLEDDVLKAIGYTAAIPVLTVAGQAYRAGFASESNSKDGVSRSVSYTSSATYGVYSATINQYQDWLKTNIPRLTKRYRGFNMVTL